MKAYSENLVSNSSGVTQQDALSLAHQHLEESARIRTELIDLGSGVVVLQIADDSLVLYGDNLLQMRGLTENVLYDRHDKETVEVFNALARKNQEIAEATCFQDTCVHRDGHVFEIFANDHTSVVWQSQSLPAVDTELLARPESVLHDIQNALDHVSAYRNSILQVLATLQGNSSRCYLKLESCLTCPLSVNTQSAAKMVAYRAATQILKSERIALAAHTHDLSAIARSCLA